MCCNCNYDDGTEMPDVVEGVCSVCYSVLCDSCCENCICSGCKRLVCDEHCTKCCLCWKRVCTASKCSDKFYYCKLCKNNFCSYDYEEHQKMNKLEPYKLNCQLVKCKIKLTTKSLASVEEMCKYLTHLSQLKEIQLRIVNNKKITTWVIKE